MIGTGRLSLLKVVETLSVAPMQHSAATLLAKGLNSVGSTFFSRLPLAVFLLRFSALLTFFAIFLLPLEVLFEPVISEWCDFPRCCWLGRGFSFCDCSLSLPFFSLLFATARPML